tara:strand:+ start:2401 stop:2658 length:258 start_codon:yes stop_codon:yes gene_type:complete
MIEDIVFIAHRSIEGGSHHPSDRSLYTGELTGPRIWDDRLGIHFFSVRVDPQKEWQRETPFIGNVPETAVLDVNERILESFSDTI